MDKNQKNKYKHTYSLNDVIKMVWIAAKWTALALSLIYLTIAPNEPAVTVVGYGLYTMLYMAPIISISWTFWKSFPNFFSATEFIKALGFFTVINALIRFCGDSIYLWVQENPTKAVVAFAALTLAGLVTHFIKIGMTLGPADSSLKN